MGEKRTFACSKVHSDDAARFDLATSAPISVFCCFCCGCCWCPSETVSDGIDFPSVSTPSGGPEGRGDDDGEDPSSLSLDTRSAGTNDSVLVAPVVAVVIMAVSGVTILCELLLQSVQSFRSLSQLYHPVSTKLSQRLDQSGKSNSTHCYGTSLWWYEGE